MNVLAKRAPGLIHKCSQCNALLAYTIQDIYEHKYIYCPLCRSKELVALDLSYDGVIRNDK